MNEPSPLDYTHEGPIDEVEQGLEEHMCGPHHAHIGEVAEIPEDTEPALDVEAEPEPPMHPLSMINWEPDPKTIPVKPDSAIAKLFDKFEISVFRKHPYSWDTWSRIRKYVPKDMRTLIRSTWETYWHSQEMGPDAFRTVLTLVRRKIGLPFDEGVLHQLRGDTGDEAVQAESEEPPVQEVCEEGETGERAAELETVSDEEA